jgi:hypothetical protein
MDTPFTDLWYYVLKSASKVDDKIWKALSNKKNFHEGRNVPFNPPNEAKSPLTPAFGGKYEDFQ